MELENNLKADVFVTNYFLDTNDCTQEGQTQKRDCETCTCRDKKWKCTNTGCPETRAKRGKRQRYKDS